MCMGDEFLTIDSLLNTKVLPKLMGNWFCTPISFKNLNKKYVIFNLSHRLF